MFKRIFLLSVLITTLLSLSSCNLTNRDLHEVTHKIDVPPKMLFLGDSIPAGYGLEGYSKDDLYSCRSYPNILADKYQKELSDECGNEMINRSVSGATSTDLLNLINSGSLDDDLRECNAIVISIGGNDLLGLIFKLFEKIGYSPENDDFNYKNIDILGAADQLTSMDLEADEALDGFDKNLPKIIHEINARSSGVIYVQTLYDPLEYYSNIPKIDNFSSNKIDRFNDIVKKHSEGNYVVVNVADEFKGQAEIVTNIKDFDIHPNYLGHQLIADEIDKAFRETSFTYITEEYGEEYITKEGYIAIASSFVLFLVALTVPVILVSRATKRKKNNK